MVYRNHSRKLRITFEGAHKKCREGFNCTGPGCIVITGKTARKASRHAVRHP